MATTDDLLQAPGSVNLPIYVTNLMAKISAVLRTTLLYRDYLQVTILFIRSIWPREIRSITSNSLLTFTTYVSPC